MGSVDPADELSAEVVLRTRSGTRAPPLSADTLEQYRPDPARAGRLRAWFREQGFETTPVHGISFSITGRRALFEGTFGLGLGGAGREPGRDIVELPLAGLPEDLAGAVDAVTFTPPPDFGPGSF